MNNNTVETGEGGTAVVAGVTLFHGTNKIQEFWMLTNDWVGLVKADVLTHRKLLLNLNAGKMFMRLWQQSCGGF